MAGITYIGPDGRLQDDATRRTEEKDPGLAIPDYLPKDLKGPLTIKEQLIFCAEVKLMKDIPYIRSILERVCPVSMKHLNDDDIIAAAHMVRVGLVTATERERLDSRDYLTRRGYPIPKPHYSPIGGKK